jgi:hypothetical protein
VNNHVFVMFIANDLINLFAIPHKLMEKLHFDS